MPDNLSSPPVAPQFDDPRENDPRLNRPAVKIPRLLVGMVGADMALLFAPRFGLLLEFFNIHPLLSFALTIAGVAIFVWAMRGVYDYTPRKRKLRQQPAMPVPPDEILP